MDELCSTSKGIYELLAHDSSPHLFVSISRYRGNVLL